MWGWNLGDSFGDGFFDGGILGELGLGVEGKSNMAYRFWL